MTQSEWIELGIALLCAIGASLLAAVETALSVITKSRAERLVEEDVRGGDRILLITQDPAPTINAVMFARMALEISSIVVATIVMFTQFEVDWQRALATIAIMLVVSFILWGVAPRTIGRQKPEATLRAFGPVISALTTVLGPVAQLMVYLGNALTPGRGYADGPFATEAELRDLVDMAQAHDLIEAGESKMIHSVFELGDTIVKEVMVPRTDVVFVTRDKTLRQLLSLALRSGFSRIPVIGESLDDVLGVAYLKDVAKRIHDFPDAERLETVGDIMRPAAFCPDSKPVSELLREMQLSHSHLVMVIDEFGGTAGLATIEDILEEIVGEIVDEYDHDTPAVTELGEGRYRISSRLPLDELGALFGVDLEDDEVETAGGLMAKLLNLVPIPGSRAVVGDLELVADRAVGRRHQIGTVLVRRLSRDELDHHIPQENTDD
ncbi:HlyC/CorC family transporter [Tessaracoccus sp. MC1865]|uniref:hemolysin family protein n=1 Tax=Tessaracoccus sp. MC1865 TaxID=2760310 RepID=UPI0016009A67|nr:hemolysin family protein [Tessaracoccus sp. MC1865]MBB1484775.1 HlyC/CorC family transporter [Tessaracoccus sp. MC1865]QTO36287.1 HlyC/CorC family transporter [Tessaracoccus sp. MC1865]